MSIALGGNHISKAYIGATEIQKMYLGSELVFDNTTPVTTLKPIMTNFRVNSATPTHIHFDDPLGPVTGVDFNDFIIEGKTITAINALLGYITVSSPLNYYDNILIRKEGGNNAVVYDFTVQYIDNLIDEPPAIDNEFYVTDSGGTGTGAIGDPWDIEYAATQLVGGETVHVKAGTYTNKNVSFSNAGTSDKPIKFIGYKTTPGDAQQLTRSIGMSFSATDMPLITGGTGNAIITNNLDYIIIKNIQIEAGYGYTWGIYLNNSQYCVLDNVYTNETDGAAIYAKDNDSKNIRVTNSYVANSHSAGILLENQYNLIKNCWAVSSKLVGMDYYLTFRAGADGHSNCFIDSYVRRFPTDSHGGHGLSFRGDLVTDTLKHSLAQDCEAVNMTNGSVEFRRTSSTHNVARNVTITRDDTDVAIRAITFKSGTDNNVVEDCIVDGTGVHTGINSPFAIYFDSWTAEDPTYKYGGKDNIVKNTIIKDMGTVVAITIDPADSGPEQNTGNQFINLTIVNGDTLVNDTTDTFNSTNSFVNCIVDSIASKGTAASTYTMTYSDFWNGFTQPAGTGNFSVDPQLDANYQPQATFTDIDVPRIDGVFYDKNGGERALPNTTVGSIKSTGEAGGEVPTVSNYVFDGSANSYFLDESATPTLLDGVVNQTWIIRVKRTAIGVQQGILGSPDGVSVIKLEVDIGDNQMDGTLDDTGNSVFTNGAVSTDLDWHVYALYYDGTNFGVWEDASYERTSVSAGFTGRTPGRTLAVGISVIGGANEGLLIGEMSDVQFYNRLLTDIEIQNVSADLTDLPTDSATSLVANFAGNKTETEWASEVGGYVLTNQGGVTTN